MGILLFSNTYASIFVFLLIISVAFLNGATDACNSISGIVSSGIWSLKKASIICGAANFLGVFIFSRLFSGVVENVFELGDFGNYGLQAVCASLLGVIIFSMVSWMLSLPSSESHALLSCIAGATAALSGRVFMIYALLTIVGYMIFSCIIALAFSFTLSKIFKKSGRACTKSEMLACIFSSFMHGAQDGQKLVAMMLLLVSRQNGGPVRAPVGICVCIGLTVMAGTLLGGGRMVNTLGNQLVETDGSLALVSDASSSLCILVCSLLGFPVSTGNIKACSSVGAGLGSHRAINKSTLKNLTAVSLLTFPVCVALGYFLTELFILLF